MAEYRETFDEDFHTHYINDTPYKIGKYAFPKEIALIVFDAEVDIALRIFFSFGIKEMPNCQTENQKSE